MLGHGTSVVVFNVRLKAWAHPRANGKSNGNSQTGGEKEVFLSLSWQSHLIGPFPGSSGSWLVLLSLRRAAWMVR